MICPKLFRMIVRTVAFLVTLQYCAELPRLCWDVMQSLDGSGFNHQISSCWLYQFWDHWHEQSHVWLYPDWYRLQKADIRALTHMMSWAESFRWLYQLFSHLMAPGDVSSTTTPQICFNQDFERNSSNLRTVLDNSRFVLLAPSEEMSDGTSYVNGWSSEFNFDAHCTSQFTIQWPWGFALTQETLVCQNMSKDVTCPKVVRGTHLLMLSLCPAPNSEFFGQHFGMEGPMQLSQHVTSPYHPAWDRRAWRCMSIDGGRPRGGIGAARSCNPIGTRALEDVRTLLDDSQTIPPTYTHWSLETWTDCQPPRCHHCSCNFRLQISNHTPQTCFQHPALRGWTGALRSGQGRRDVSRKKLMSDGNMKINEVRSTRFFASPVLNHLYNDLGFCIDSRNTRVSLMSKHVKRCHLSKWSAMSLL